MKNSYRKAFYIVFALCISGRNMFKTVLSDYHITLMDAFTTVIQYKKKNSPLAHVIDNYETLPMLGV